MTRSPEEIQALKPHPALLKLPPLTVMEREAQVACIRTHGLLRPVLIRDGYVLDGWHLLQAALVEGVQPYFQILPNDHSTELPLDLNMARRGLTKSQRAMIGAEIVQSSLVSPGGSPVLASVRSVSKRMCVSPTYVTRALHVLQQDPEMSAGVKSGKLDIPDAERQLREREALARRMMYGSLDTAASDLVTLHREKFQTALTSIPEGSIAAIVTDPLYSLEARPDWVDLGRLAHDKLRAGGALVAMTGDHTMLAMADAIREGGSALQFWRQITIRLYGRVNSCEGILARTRKVLVFYKPAPGLHKPFTACLPSDLIEEARGSDTIAHPYAQKVEMFLPLIRWFSAPGDVIVEPFAGGGTVVLACGQLGRRCIACESDQAAFERMQACLFGAGGIDGKETLSAAAVSHPHMPGSRSCLQSSEHESPECSAADAAS